MVGLFTKIKMKRETRTHVFFIIFMSAVFHGVYASVTDAELSRALMALKGLEYGMTEQLAVETVREAAMNSGNARAINALGLFYLNGTFVEKDTLMGVNLLEEAGRSGYAVAYHNLGVTYKLARYGIGQNLDRAFAYYSAGADSGSVSCMYDAGYMLYKGLGCRQDYGKAARLFDSAASHDHPNAMYMLGLCYRNGYGVERDDERASYYLNRAAMLGSRYAMEELLRPEPENCLEDIIAIKNTDMEIPENMPVVAPQVNDTSIVKGEYTGYLVMYDWSGQHVIGEKPVSATIMRDGDDVHGELVLGVDTIPYIASLTADGKMLFRNITTSMNERYTPNRRTPYRLDHVQLDIWNESLRGDVALYNLREKEPERPMYMELQRIGGSGEENNALYCHVTAAPNPFSASFDAVFELPGEAEATVHIFNQLGIKVWNRELGTLEEGKHSVSINPNIVDGTYVLNITAGRRVFRTIIVKNGGSK